VPSPTWTRLVIALAASLWFATALVMQAPVDAELLKPAGLVMSAVVLVLLCFDWWVWKLLPASLTRRPNLQGTWQATLEYRWPPNSPTQTKDCYLVIRQTYSTVRVDMLFDISTSESTSARLITEGGRSDLSWTYWSVARVDKRQGNPPHRGAAHAVVSSLKAPALEGEYWTDRQTVGRISTGGRSRTLHRAYDEAKADDYS